nr:integrase, catalytic region, zinc finger, CCHC-type, peptidase aspartic, catalytic [Tanacetum cinerariifolium]
MVNSSLKKLKFHLASFDMVIKERTTTTAITEGTWAFEHTKACFRDEIIPFVKALKELFNSFDQFLIDELTEVQNVFNQMEQAVKQHCVEKNKFQDKMEKVLKDNERLLKQALSIDIVNIVVHDHVNFTDKTVNTNNSFSEQSASTFAELFKINDLKAQSQAKDTVILKLKERLQSLSGNVEEKKVKRDLEEIKTINIELDHRVTKLVAENEHLKQTYKQLLQEKVSVITTLKENLSKLKGKVVVNEVVSLHSIDPELLKIDVAPLAPKLRNNRTAHTDYLRYTQEETATLREIVERVTLLSSASGSQPQGNTKNDRIQRTPSKAKKNKLEYHPRKVRPSLNKKKSVVDTKAISSVTNSKLNVNDDLKCATCNGCLFFDNHDSCVLAYINSVNASIKSKFVKKPVHRKIWQPTGKMFTTVGHIWKPTRRTFTLVGNACPLTRIATATIVPLRQPIPIESNTDKPVVTLVYSRKSKAAKKKVPVSNLNINKSLVIQIVLWYLDSGCSKHMTGDLSQLINFVQKFLGTVKFGNDHVAKIMGFGDYKIGNVTILRVYFVEGLWHNLFLVGQFCDSDLEVAFRQHTCFIRNLDGVDLLTGSRGNNLYTLSLQDMMASSPICLLSMSSKTKFWLWHRRLSHLNFSAINHLARQGLVRGLLKLKFEKDHLCSACAMGKSSHISSCTLRIQQHNPCSKFVSTVRDNNATDCDMPIMTENDISLPLVGERVIEGPEMIKVTNEKVKVAVAKEKLKEARTRQKSYADKHHRSIEFQPGDRVFLKVSPARGVRRFGIKGNLSPRFIGPFKILDRVGEVSYRLALPPQLSHVHNVFHVSLLRGYKYYPLHVVSYPLDQIRTDLSYNEEPEAILDRQDRVMRNKTIPF